MSSRLEPINLTDFSGGLNLHETDFQLADNESPLMLNVNADPRGGIVTRPGWQAWNDTDAVVDPETTWRPRNALMHGYSDGNFGVFVSNDGIVLAAQPGDAFVDMDVTAAADPHLADFAGWGDTMYLGCGRTEPVAKVVGPPAVGNVATPLTELATGNYNDDYTIVVGGVAPACEHLEAHGGYMFAANIIENATTYPNRVRWSHPDEPEDWAEMDYIDILAGGSKITAIRSFRDHLVIFKVDSVWALYGYDRDSWQLIKVSSAVGSPAPSAVTKSEEAVYFYSSTGRNGIYGYSGDDPVLLSEKLRRATDAINDDHDVFLGWIARRLWCQLPYQFDEVDGSHGGLYIFDPELGGGAWIHYKPARGTMACIVEHSDIGVEFPLVATCGCTGFAGVMRVSVAPLVAADVFSTGEGPVGFRSNYRTCWKHAGWPERQKSWLRPRVIARRAPQPVAVRMDTYWNYNSSSPQRTHVFNVIGSEVAYWREFGDADPQGFDWGDGTMWSAAERFGDVIVRPVSANPGTGRGSLGWARAIQLDFQPEDYTLGLPWSVDAVILKFNARRFTT